RAVRQSPKSRRLRMEPLENRALLAVDAFGGGASLAESNVEETWGPDPAPAAFSASVLATDAAIVDVSGVNATSTAASFSVQTETPEPVAPPSFEQLMEALGQVKIESLDDEFDAASLSYLDDATDETAATSDAVARRVVFYDSSADDFDASFLNVCEPNLYYIDTASSVAETTGVSSRSGGSDGVYAQITPLGSTLLLECDGFPSGGGIAESFFSVVVPNLGSTSRALRVTPSAGSGAILNQDYIVVANSPDGEGPAEPYAIGGGDYFDVSGGTTFYVVPLNESVIEAKEDFSLGLSVVEYGSGGGTVAELEPIIASIVDDDTFSLDSVTFNDIGLCPDPTVITSTPPNPAPWNDPHWVKNHPELTFPVLYACVEEEAINCDAVISGEIDPTYSYEIRAVWEYDGETYVSDWSAYNNGNANVEFFKTFLEIFGERQAYYAPNFTLTWEFKIVGEDTVREIGDSINPLYVTYDAPATLNLYHTVVHTGCAAASGKNTETDVFDAIWEKFESLNIKEVTVVNGAVVEGETLSYYGKDPIGDDEEILKELYFDTSLTACNTPSRAREIYIDTGLSGTYFLLAGLDGTCVDWQPFALNVLQAQGLAPTSVSITVAPSPETPGQYDAIQVSPLLLGQGGGTPRENIWKGHELIEYNGKIYDPSYGKDYGAANAAAQTFISQALVSVGEVVSVTPAPHNDYGKRYKPQKTSEFEINQDLYFSWPTSVEE
ncbi:MAG: hypothetical protein IKY61_01420, partial [Thermoguttaceae bacterium]|nr:hypothetical protein [Thermoguttaceae bacterium]